MFIQIIELRTFHNSAMSLVSMTGITKTKNLSLITSVCFIDIPFNTNVTLILSWGASVPVLGRTLYLIRQVVFI